ncbi:MAG TPA: urease accessory protein UreD [Burkholderiales bacterium]|nr:urease accessory protein UreD [Burkholderiales bacterium]
MHADPLIEANSWRAELALEYEFRNGRTVLAARRHDGPLVVQKPFYPEGDAVCHNIIVHPPAGIAGGDALTIGASVGGGAATLLTTPGAGKWYRSAGPWAEQRIRFDVAAGASLEWLPQETIVFDGALAQLRNEVCLTGDARYIGWEILCLGRTGSGESFTRGECRTRTLVRRDGRPLWLERARIEGGGDALTSTAVLAGHPIAGTLVATAPMIERDVLLACREPKPVSGEGAVTSMPGLLVARYLGASSEAAKNYFTQLWRILRPALTGRTANEPRIWRT